MQEITEQTVQDVIDFTLRIKGMRYVPSRKIEFTSFVKTADESTKWLLSFCAWHCMFNSKYRAISEERFIGLLVSQLNKSTFLDFISYLRKHEDINVTVSREAATGRFLSKCDMQHQAFYKSLMTKDWINGFPMLELQAQLDIDSITREEIYRGLNYLKTGFSELSYPVTLRLVPNTNLRSCLVTKESTFSSLMMLDSAGNARNMDKPDWLVIDLKLSSTPRYALGGFLDGNRLYPIDYFPSSAESMAYRSGEPERPYQERIQQLNRFLESNMLINTWSDKAIYVENEEQLINSLPSILRDKSGDLLITDENTARTGVMHRVRCELAKGTIEDVIVKEAEAVGFTVWFNGELIDCPYKFEGKEQSILSARDTVRGKVFKFYLVKLNEIRHVGNRIVWREERWKRKRLRGSDKWIEKCILCGSTNIRHSVNGMCASCENNLVYYFKKFGPDVWIEPSKQMLNKRESNSWSSNLLNSVKFKYKGLLLEAMEDGRWRFKTEEEG